MQGRCSNGITVGAGILHLLADIEESKCESEGCRRTPREDSVSGGHINGRFA